MNQRHERLTWARENAGFEKASAFAEAIGVKPGTYRNHETGFRQFHEKSARVYGERLRVSWKWLLSGDGSPHDLEEDNIDEISKEPEVALSVEVRHRPSHGPMASLGEFIAAKLPAIPAIPQRLPIYDTRDIDGIFMAAAGAPIELAIRPRALSNSPKAYGLEISNNAMHPKYELKSIVYVDPSKRPRTGKSGILLLSDGRIFIGEFVNIDTECYLMRSYHPETREHRFAFKEIVGLHAIVASEE